MRRIRLFLVAAASCLVINLFAQAPPPSPGGVSVPRPGGPAAQRPGLPGLPPRDPNGTVPTGTAVLGGRVTIASSGTPLRHAQVMLTAVDQPAQQIRRSTTTDAEGRYRFADLPAGRYSVTANKAGYVSQQYGQRRANEAGTPVPIGDGQTVNAINLSLQRGGVIAGRITDEYGEPIARAMVQALRYFYGPDGQRRPQPSASSTTDDLGQFRLFGLTPGEYVVSASAQQGFGGGQLMVDTGETYLTSYFPGSPNINDAQTVPLAAGQEATVQLALSSGRLSRVAGIVVDSSGKPVANAMTILTAATGAFFVGHMGGGPTAADGSFSMSNVAPGDYILNVQPNMRPGEASLTETGSLPITVGGADLLNLRITTSSGVTITGRVVFEGAARRDNGAGGQFRVFAQPAEQFQGVGLGLQPAPVADDGSFEIKGARGSLLFRVAASQDWALKSVSLEGQDITDTPTDVNGREGLSGVRIVLTDKLTDMSGRVTDARGQVLKDYVVVLQPAEEKSGAALTRYLRTVRPDRDGRFQTKGLPPGSYDATAVASLEQGRQFVPEVQARLRTSAHRFTVREGQTLSLDLKLSEDVD